MPEASTTLMQNWIAQMNAGDAAGRDRLLEHTCDRLRRLTRRMLQDFRSVQGHAETDDVLQNSLVRLLRALEAAPPDSVPSFFRLATLQIRRELIDLSRRYGKSPPGLGLQAADSSDNTPPPAQEVSDSTYEPGRLAAWAELHERVGALPADERDVFDLLWYQGLTQAEAATVIGVSVPTIKRRWLAARLQLQDALPGELPV